MAKPNPVRQGAEANLGETSAVITEAAPSGGSEDPRPDDPADAAANPPAAPGSDAPPAISPSADEEAPPTEASFSMEIDPDNPPPQLREPSVALIKAYLRDMPDGLRAMFLQAAAEIAVELQAAPESEPSQQGERRVRVEKNFQVRFAGQKFHLIAGNVIANQELADHLLAGSFPVKRLEGSDA